MAKKVRRTMLTLSLTCENQEQLSPHLPEWTEDQVRARHEKRIRSILRSHGYVVSGMNFAVLGLEYRTTKKRNPREFRQDGSAP